MEKENDVAIITVMATRMRNSTSRNAAENLRIILLLVKIDKYIKFSLLIVPLMAAMQSLAVTVKWKTVLMELRMGPTSIWNWF